ncbi:MAG: GntR family transcriptional regulator [Rhodobacterales bacterium]|jgi:DNA-binding GntR family transcriptional regulator
MQAEADGKSYEIQVKTLTDQVFDAVVLAVMEKRIPFGARLKEADIAQQLNVSRMPVREALLRLVSEGIVTNTPYKGMCLMEVDEKKLKEILEVRLALEREAFRLAIEQLALGQGDISDTQAVLDRMSEACAAQSGARMAQCDIDYHRSVLRLSGNETLRRVWEMMARQFQMIVGIAWHVTDPRAILESHTVLHSAVGALDQGRVQELLGPHIMEGISIGLGDLANRS